MDSMQRVLSYFREICSIPRRSGDESNVAQYLIETGKRLGLGVDQDSCGNVVLRKTISQATPSTILQAHMDMVWESTGTPYQKGVSLRETDECLHAVGSTLGADNGIGMAKEQLLELQKTLDEKIVNYEKHFGIGNVNKRISNPYFGNGRISVESCLYEGTSITIEFDQMEKYDEECNDCR